MGTDTPLASLKRIFATAVERVTALLKISLIVELEGMFLYVLVPLLMPLTCNDVLANATTIGGSTVALLPSFFEQENKNQIIQIPALNFFISCD